MLVLDLNVMGLKNNKASYLAWIENKLEGNSLSHRAPLPQIQILLSEARTFHSEALDGNSRHSGSSLNAVLSHIVRVALYGSYLSIH